MNGSQACYLGYREHASVKMDPCVLCFYFLRPSYQGNISWNYCPQTLIVLVDSISVRSPGLTTRNQIIIEIYNICVVAGRRGSAELGCSGNAHPGATQGPT